MITIVNYINNFCAAILSLCCVGLFQEVCGEIFELFMKTLQNAFIKQLLTKFHMEHMVKEQLKFSIV
jgi:F0F1-type ATP synthase membrane subunit a